MIPYAFLARKRDLTAILIRFWLFQFRVALDAKERQPLGFGYHEGSYLSNPGDMPEQIRTVPKRHRHRGFARIFTDRASGVRLGEKHGGYFRSSNLSILLFIGSLPRYTRSVRLGISSPRRSALNAQWIALFENQNR